MFRFAVEQYGEHGTIPIRFLYPYRLNLPRLIRWHNLPSLFVKPLERNELIASPDQLFLNLFDGPRSIARALLSHSLDQFVEIGTIRNNTGNCPKARTLRHLAGEHLVEQQAQGEDVRSLVDHCTPCSLLRSRVQEVRKSVILLRLHCGQKVLFLKMCNSKICNKQEIPFRIVQDILRF